MDLHTERRARTGAVEGVLSQPDIHADWMATFRSAESDAFFRAAFGFVAANFRPSTRVLDLGCGTGAHTLRLARNGFEVVGVDLSESALHAAMKEVDRAGMSPRVALQRGNILELSFAQGSFDAILCWGVLMHVPEIDRALDEIARVTAPGGRVVVNEVNVWSVEAIIFRVIRQTRRRAITAQNTDAGVELWSERLGGSLLSRQTRMRWLINEFDRRGFLLTARRAGHSTAAFTRIGSIRIRRVIHAFNLFWFEKIRWAKPALTNILVFEKRN